LDAAADRDFLRQDTAFDLCAFADHEARGAQFAIDPAEHLRRPPAFDVANDRHAGSDARDGRRHRRRRVLVNGRTRHGFVILLKRLALEHLLPLVSCKRTRRG
jgi:hypothetical protein